jgi:hypothetical protein
VSNKEATTPSGATTVARRLEAVQITPAEAIELNKAQKARVRQAVRATIPKPQYKPLRKLKIPKPKSLNPGKAARSKGDYINLLKLANEGNKSLLEKAANDAIVAFAERDRAENRLLKKELEVEQLKLRLALRGNPPTPDPPTTPYGVPAYIPVVAPPPPPVRRVVYPNPASIPRPPTLGLGVPKGATRNRGARNKGQARKFYEYRNLKRAAADLARAEAAKRAKRAERAEESVTKSVTLESEDTLSSEGSTTQGSAERAVPAEREKSERAERAMSE